MDSMRSERFRYLLPGSYLIICLALIYYPQLLTNNASNKFSNIFILGIGAIIGGFLLNRLSTSTIFRLLIGFGGSKTVHGKDTAELVVYKVLDELNIRSTPTGNKVIQKTAEIFDDFLNEECDDKVIGRFFFLCDMEHAFATLSLCSISVIIISALTIIEIVGMSTQN